jgi:hypothetical protein
MRFAKSGLGALAMLLAAGGPALALDVDKHIAAPGQLLVVWTLASEFCALKDWHPDVTACEESKEGDATIRTVTLKDGGKMKDKLTESDDSSYSYEVIETTLPVKNFQGKLWVEPDARQTDRTVIHWDATFDPNGVSDDDATKAVRDFFNDGLIGLKHKAMPPDENNPGNEDRD